MRRTPLLRLSPVSTFPRVDKLVRFEGLRRKVVQLKLVTAEALGFGRESRIFSERETERENMGGLAGLPPVRA